MLVLSVPFTVAKDVLATWSKFLTCTSRGPLAMCGTREWLRCYVGGGTSHLKHLFKLLVRLLSRERSGISSHSTLHVQPSGRTAFTLSNLHSFSSPRGLYVFHTSLRCSCSSTDLRVGHRIPCGSKALRQVLPRCDDAVLESRG